MTKTDFIRSMPNAKPREIVAAAKAKGMTIAVEYVYNIRQNIKRNSGVQAVRALDRAPVITLSQVRDVPKPADAERRFISLVLDLGTVRAQELLDEMRQRVLAAASRSAS